MATPITAADPFAGLESTSPASADPFAGLEPVSAPAADAFSGLTPADDLDVKDEQTLVDDDAFSPAEYLSANPTVQQDAAKSQKLLNVYRARRIRGLEAGKVVKAAVTETPGLIKKIAGGAADLVTRGVDIAIQPAVNKALGFVFATPEERKGIEEETGRRQLKAASEVVAGTETAITGLAQLGQQGTRKLFGKSPEKQTDTELLDDLHVDAQFAKTMKDVSSGQGDASAIIGLDAETLAKDGIVLDKDAIERLSLVDPVTLVATGGAFKVAGAGGRIIAQAATRAGAGKVMTALATAAAKAIEASGRVGQAVGQTAAGVIEKVPAKSLGALAGGLKTGTLTGTAVGAAAGEAAKRIGVEAAEALAKKGTSIAELGQQLSPGFIGPKTAGLQRIANIAASPAGQVAKEAVKGAAQGVAAAAPLALASEDSQTAGALLGAGGALGGIARGAGAVKKVAVESVAKNYLDPAQIHFEDTKSPAYGTDVALDKSHQSAVTQLTPQEKNMVNAFRESVRNAGGEIYAQDGANYLDRIKESMAREKGEALTPQEESLAETYAKSHAFFDGVLTDAQGFPRRAIFLNSSAKGLPHDAGHLFQALLSPERQAELRTTALESYTPEQISAFQQEYAARLGDPEYFSRLGEEGGRLKAADELIAENYGQLFRNTPLADLKAPRTFLQKLGQTAVEAGESLGLDLTAGRVTPDLQATPSFRLQGILRNAAQEVLTRPEAPLQGPALPPPAPPTPVPAPPTPPPVQLAAPRSLGMAPTPLLTPEVINPASNVPPAALTPDVVGPRVETPQAQPPTPPSAEARNIRVTPEQQAGPEAARAQETGIAEAQKATENTPERATVDTIAKSMQEGNPALEIEHRGIASPGTAGAPEGRTSRRGTQAAGYEQLAELQIKNRAEAPESIVNAHQKTFVPVRFITQGGKPTLIAMSLDKVIANVARVVKDSAAKKVESLLPYPTEGGKLTEAGWTQAMSDIRSYAENQANGYRGDGQKLVRPTEDIGVSIPAENPNYTPKPISEAAMNFANLVQGLNPPETARAQKGAVPGNVKGQIIAEVNARQPMTPSVISPETVTKQEFKGYKGRTIKETNPLRNELASRGVPVRELIEVTERLAVQDIATVNPRPDVAFSAPVTDIIRGGFLPQKSPVEIELARRLEEKQKAGIDLTETVRQQARQEAEYAVRTGTAGKPKPNKAQFFLPDEVRSVEDIGAQIEGLNAEEWRNWTQQKEGGLTGEAYRMGLSAPNEAYVAKLAEYRDRMNAKFREKMAAGDLDEAYPFATKGQLFSEAYGAATGGASARKGLSVMGISEAKIPFPNYDPAKRSFLPGKEPSPIDAEVTRRLEQKKKDGVPVTEAVRAKTRQEVEFDSRNGRLSKPKESMAQFFLPSTETGKKLAKDGYDFQMTGEPGVRSIQLLKDGKQIGEIRSRQTNGTSAEIEMVKIDKEFRAPGKGLAEGLYRELFSQLKEDGVDLVEGTVVAPEPLAIRNKIFEGNFERLEYNGEPVGLGEGLLLANELSGNKSKELINLDVANRIRPEMSFLPEDVRAKQAGNPEVRDLAEKYAKSAGVTYAPRNTYAEVDPKLAREIAEFYEQADSTPGDPKVKASYKALISEVADQFEAIRKAGYTIEPFKGKGEPYRNSAEAVTDIRDNKHLFYLETEGNFGAGAGDSENLMLADSGVKIDDKPVPANDIFRAVHDFFGHGKEGYQFGPRGEFNAWRAHSEMFSPEAQGALAAETLAQNSWVNYGEHLRDSFGELPEKGQPGYLNPAERPFARQKNIVIPDELIERAKRQASGSPAFLPDDVKPKKGRRDDQGRPLTREGLVDYQKYYKELTEEREAVAAKNLASVDVAKYETPRGAQRTEKVTGWILPDADFVPLDMAYHQDWLAENSGRLNKSFGTKFTNKSSEEARLNALNNGFVRVRNERGAVAVELNERFYKGAVKKAVEQQLVDKAEAIDRLRVSLLDDDGQVVNSAVGRIFDAENPSAAITEVLADLKPVSVRAPKRGPSAIARARSFPVD